MPAEGEASSAAANATASSTTTKSSTSIAQRVRASADEDLKDEVLQHRTVIDVELIIKAVKDDRMQQIDTVGNAPDYDEAVDLQEIKSLTLSFKNVYQIDNLAGFQNLVRLQLDNNIISRIENLDHLVNLRWLDLSFNNLKRIEGLDKLTQLTDLSLFNNDIEQIENLDALVNLNVLSLGNNNIEQVDQVKRLRKFKNLRLLNLKGNPVYELDDYQATVFAYLTSLKYLDYELIEPDQFRKARDAKLDHIVELEERERLQEAEALEVERAAAVVALAEEANLHGLATLFQDMIKADNEHATLCILPGFQAIIEQYQTMFESITKEFSAVVLERHAVKLKESALFDDVMSKVRRDVERASICKLQEYESTKKKIYAAFAQAITERRALRLAGPESNSGASGGAPGGSGASAVVGSGVGGPEAFLAELKQEILALNNELMELEMELAGQLNEVINQFDNIYTALVGHNLNKVASCFRALSDVSNSYVDSAHELVHELLEQYHANPDLVSAYSAGGTNPATATTPGAGSSGGGRKGSAIFKDDKPGDNTKSSTTATSMKEATVSGKDNNDKKDNNDAEDGGDGADDESEATAPTTTPFAPSLFLEGGASPELLTLLQDKDLVNNAVSTSHDTHLAKVLAKEDEIRDREDNTAKSKLKALRKEEYDRNRQRVHEICKYTQREMALLEERSRWMRTTGDISDDEGDL